MVLEAMLRVARSSVMGNPRLAECNPQSFLLALLKCARAGLYPDGREAHLIPFKQDVQCIFDWKGIVALCRRSGVDVTAKLVHENDEFEVNEDDGTGKTCLIHKANYKEGRGEPIAVWSRARYKDGRVDYEIMTIDEVEEVRQHYSRAKDSEAWVKSFGEMAKKTVIRRHSKRWDLSPELRETIFADDDTPPPPALVTVEPKLPPVVPKEEPVVEQESVVVVDEEPPPQEPEAEPPQPWDKGRKSKSPAVAALIKRLRLKLKDQKIEEAELLEFMTGVGAIDDQCTTLEQASVDSLDTVEMVDKQWDDIAARIEAARTQ